MIRPAALALLATAAPAAAATGGDQFLHVTFDCPGGEVLEAVFINTAAGDSHAVVTRGDGLMPMTVAISASGARYTTLPDAAPFTFWTKGDSASLYKSADETPVLADCTAR